MRPRFPRASSARRAASVSRAVAGVGLVCALMWAGVWAGPALAHKGATPAQSPALPPAPAADAIAPKPAPKLLVAIAVDQFSADLYAQYRADFTGGLARLAQGAVFPSAYQSHAATETCPGHSTLLTGDHPARTGIIANNWYDFGAGRADKRIYCAEDEANPASSATDPVVSAVHLKVPTLGEWMKRQWPASRNVAVSAKDRAVMMMGGHLIDEAYWWRARGFTSLQNRTLAPAALDENANVLALVAKGAPALAVPDWCRARDRAVAAGDTSVGAGRFRLAADQFDDYRVSPRIDAATLDLAARLVRDMKLGGGAAPDMLSISLSATDYIGHAYGTQGLEMCIQMHELDQKLGAFFARLDAAGIDYAVVLSADHGGIDIAERMAEQGAPGAMRVDKALSAKALSAAIAARLGIAHAGPIIVAEGSFGDYWVAHDLAPEVRGQVIAALVAAFKAHPQVAGVFTKAQIAAHALPSGNPQDWSMLDRARASFDAERSGDVYMMLGRAVSPIAEAHAGYTATHGSPYDYDRRVPLLFWRRAVAGFGVAGFEQAQPVETVDIAPTLAALIGLNVGEGAFDGRCLDIDGGAANSCSPR